jgi:hypothetical protein
MRANAHRATEHGSNQNESCKPLAHCWKELLEHVR